MRFGVGSIFVALTQLEAVIGVSHKDLEWDASVQEIPAYITEHSPLVFLYSEERYYPGSVKDYLDHFVLSTNDRNFTVPLSINNLTSAGQDARSLVGDENAELFMTAKEQWEPEPGPDWLTKFKTNRPNLWTGKIEEAPATLVVVDKPELGVIDAFWFYFYPFNLGPFVMGHGPFGNHIGDWEHSLVRFNRTSHEPLLVWMSAHGGGTAYTWDSLLDGDVGNGERPILFSARGTHAQYTGVGRHSHDIPWHMLSDYTDHGDLWDPAQNYLAYTFDGHVVHPANGSDVDREIEFGDWLLFDGHWGNAKLDKLDPRQQWSPFEWKLIDGPTGPLFKNLMRTSPCQRFKWWNFMHACRVRKQITAGEGIDADLTGCEALLSRIPRPFRAIANIITKDGFMCYVVDRYFS